MIDLLARLHGVHKSGNGWSARCPAHDDKTNSLSVVHRDDRWLAHCFAGCSVDAIVAAIGLTVADLFDDAADRSHRWTPSTSAVRPIMDAVRGEEAAAEVAATMNAARRIWRESRSWGMGRLDAYLASRGLRQPQIGRIRYHPDLWHRRSGTSWPAMVALVTDGVTGRPIGIHRTYLDRVGVGKAPVEPNKMMLGPCRGGVVRLAPAPISSDDLDDPRRLYVAEGIETALSAMAAGCLPAWAALTAGNMKVIDLPDHIRTVVIVADADRTGIGAARAFADRLFRQGRNICIAQPPQGFDLNDVLTGKNVAEVAA